MARTILAIDPGSRKCGLAVVRPGAVLHSEVISRALTPVTAARLASEFSVDEVIMGNGTGSSELARDVETALSLPIKLVDETNSSYLARARFFQDNPPRGLRRLLPRGLLYPDRAFDDYIAIMLAEEYLRS